MGRARNIKPGFFENAELAELSVYARLLFIGLWTLADREGRLEDRPKQIRYKLMPCDQFDPEQCIAALAAGQFIYRYSVGGERYIQIANFVKHQAPHKNEKPSVIPPPTMAWTSMLPTDSEVIATLREDSGNVASLPEHSSNVAECTKALPPDSLILRFSDSLNPDSKPTPPDIPPMVEIETGTDERMTLKEFASVYAVTFGKHLPPLLHQTGSECCQVYTRQVLLAAFETAAAAGASHFNFVKKVLEKKSAAAMSDADWAALDGGEA